MTKHTNEEIIAYLKTLREGDVLTAISTERGEITKGQQYKILRDSDDDLCINLDSGDSYLVQIGRDYDCSIAGTFREGTFEIPPPAAGTTSISIRQITEVDSGGTTYKNVTVRVDDAGFAALEALEARSVATRELAGLYAKRTEIQADIDRAERSLEASQ